MNSANVVNLDSVWSASFWIQIRIGRHQGPADPDPNRYPFQPNVRLTIPYLIPENFNFLFKILKIMTPMTLTRYVKRWKLALLIIKKYKIAS